MILLKFESQEPDNIDQVLMVVPIGYSEDSAYKYAIEILGECSLVAWAELTGGNFTDGDFDGYRCFTG